MPGLFVKPVAPAGQIDGVDMAFAIDHIDAKLLIENWKAIFSKVNGGLYYSDFDPYLSSEKLDEGTQTVLERSLESPVAGAFHDHDGIHSAFLGSDAVGNTSLTGKYGSFSLLVGGSNAFRTVVYFGSAPVKNATYGTWTDSDKFRIPHNNKLFQTYYERLMWGNGGRTRVVGVLRFEENVPTTQVLAKLQLTFNLALAGSAPNQYISSVNARIDNRSTTSVADFFVDWMMVCLL